MVDGLLALTVLIAPAEDRDRCISRREYRAISKKMTRREVNKIVGYPGRTEWQHDGNNWMITGVGYRVCSPWSRKRSVVNVVFMWDANKDDWLRVIGKSGTFRRPVPKRG